LLDLLDNGPMQDELFVMFTLIAVVEKLSPASNQPCLANHMTAD
jgi:hypothetical protein